MVKYDGQRVPRSTVTAFSDVVARLAVQVAPRIAGDIVYQHGKFRIPPKGRGGLGAPVPPAVLVAAVITELPSGIDAYQREYIARAVVEHPAFMLTLQASTAEATASQNALPHPRMRQDPFCSEEDCESPSHARGLCSMHYQRMNKARLRV